MSKAKPPKKKVVVTTARPAAEPAQPRTRAQAPAAEQRALTFGRDTYIWMGGGFLLVLIGMLLMLGGHMPSPEVWDPDIIYSARRITLAPIVILAGLSVVVYAIFRK